MSRESYWLVLIVVGTGTVLMRSLPIVLHGKGSMPKLIGRLLRHVPASALAALVVPSVLYSTATGSHVFDPARLGAGVIALVVALRTRNVIATLGAGMGGLWILAMLLG
ncbi:MAG: AzlD domain-containing protein [Actinomycetota bacterium]|jgi:branched-subunit amino acid transport protein|nr:AzlD domain-containing protein [Actinomycetota bacterium]